MSEQDQVVESVEWKWRRLLELAIQRGLMPVEETDQIMAEWGRLGLIEARLLGQLSYEQLPYQRQLLMEFLGYDPTPKAVELPAIVDCTAEHCPLFERWECQCAAPGGRSVKS